MKKILLTALFVCVFCVNSGVEAMAASFSDVQSSQWHYSFVTGMSDKGYIDGYPDGKYYPDRSLTTAEFSAMLSKAFYGTTVYMVEQQGDFSTWWEPFVFSVYLRDGLVDTVLGAAIQDYANRGYRFQNWGTYVNNELTRYDMAAMAANVLIDQYVTPLTTAQINTYVNQISDVTIDSPYAEAVATCYHYGILEGHKGGGFSGNAAFKRSEAAVVLTALVEATVVKEESYSVASSTLSSSAYNVSNYNLTGNLAIENYVFARVNELRAAVGVGTLTSNNTLVGYAQTRAKESEINWAHTRPDGTSWNTVISPSDTSNFLSGENLTMGSGFRAYEYADMIFKSWLNSPGHYENMISPNHKQLGLAVYLNSDGSYYAAQIFGIPLGS